LVHGILESPAHTHIIEGFELRVKPDVEETEGGFTESLVLAVPRVVAALFRLAARDERLFEFPFQELGKHLLIGPTDLENHRVEKWSALVVPVVGLQDNFLVRLPLHQFERTSPHRRAAEVIFFSFDLLPGYYGSIRHAEHGEQRGKRLVERDLQRIAINHLQPFDALTGLLHKIAGALNPSQEIRQWSGLFGVQKARERIDEITRRHLSTIMKLYAMAQGEGPGASIARRFPKLRNGGNGIQEGIELH